MRPTVILLMALFIASSLYAQKLKYKDVYPRLTGGDPAAYSDLKSFMADSKNADHPNGNYQMGVMLEEQVFEADILKDTTIIYNKSDSAVAYLRLAKSYINEKELKKNDEYYQDFYRRDLRTGEFGINLDHVYRTIEEKIEELQSLSANVKEVNKYLTESNRWYNKSLDRFLVLTEGYNDQRKFLINATEETLIGLNQVAYRIDSFNLAFDQMKVALSKIDNPRFGPVLEWKSIEELDATYEGVDFYNNEFSLYDLKVWAEDAASQIEEKIIPLRSSIIAYDERLDGIHQNLRSASADDLRIGVDEDLIATLRTYDDDPSLERIFEIKVSEISVLAMTDTVVNPQLLDSGMVDWQVSLHDSLVHEIRHYGELIKDLKTQNLEEDFITYANYFEQRFQGKNGYLVWIDQKEEAYNGLLYTWINSKYYWSEISKWGIVESDTIPLLLTDTLYSSNYDKRFLSLNLAKDDSLNLYPVGVDFSEDKPKGFVAGFANSRNNLWFQSLDLGDVAIGDSTINVDVEFTPSESDKLTFYFYSAEQTEKNNFAIYNVNRNSDIVWSNYLQFENQPDSVKYNREVKETIIYLPPNESEESLNYVVIDRSGRVRQ